MESDSRNRMEGVVESKGREVGMHAKPRQVIRVCDLVLRVLGFALTLGAAVVLGVHKQTKIVTVKLGDTLPPLNVPVTAKFHYLSAFVYFVVANAIACGYAGMSLVVGLANKGGSKGLGAIIAVLDGVMVALLFSGNGASIAVGVIGFQGNSHVQWNKVCNVVAKFCNQVAAASVLSLLGSITFLVLLLLPILRFHRAI